MDNYYVTFNKNILLLALRMAGALDIQRKLLTLRVTFSIFLYLSLDWEDVEYIILTRSDYLQRSPAITIIR